MCVRVGDPDGDSSGAPQERQKRLDSGMSLAHDRQRIVRALVGVSAAEDYHGRC